MLRRVRPLLEALPLVGCVRLLGDVAHGIGAADWRAVDHVVQRGRGRGAGVLRGEPFRFDAEVEGGLGGRGRRGHLGGKGAASVRHPAEGPGNKTITGAFTHIY